MSQRRGEELTVRVRELAVANELTFVNMFHDLEIRRPGYWSPDRLHLNAAGHGRVAGMVLATLAGTAPPEANGAGSPQVRRLLTEARYYWEHVRPWVQRRLRGRSSGDTLTAKHADWTTTGETQPRGGGHAQPSR
jgi:hypothetical protein